MTRLQIISISLLVLCAGCSFDLDAISAPGTDGSVTDILKVDSPRPDIGAADTLKADIFITEDLLGPEAAVVDMPLTDVAVVDLAPGDLPHQDLAKPDMATPDKAIPDSATPDSAMPDLAMPDQTNPDTAAPDMAAPDMAKPDQTVPDLLTPDAGPSVKDPTGIAISTKSAVEHQVAVGSHGAGFMVLWAAGGDLFGSTMAKTGTGSLSLPFSISSYTGIQAYPALAHASSSNNYVVVWEQPGSGKGRIVASRVTTSGTSLDPLPGVKVSDGSVNQVQPAVACSATQCLVVWQDLRNVSGSLYDIYGRRFNPSTGSVIDNTDRLIAQAPGYLQIPEVAFDGVDYLVVWQHPPASGGEDVYGARFTTTGTVSDQGGVAISTAGGYSKGYPQVACDGAGGCLVVWMYGKDYSSKHIDGVITKNNGALGLKVISAADIVISNTSINALFPDVAYGGSDYVVVWQHGSSTVANIAGTRVSKAGVVSTAPLLNISLATGHQAKPVVARGTSQFLVAWDDNRNGNNTDIYGARVGP